MYLPVAVPMSISSGARSIYLWSLERMTFSTFVARKCHEFNPCCMQADIDTMVQY